MLEGRCIMAVELIVHVNQQGKVIGVLKPKTSTGTDWVPLDPAADYFNQNAAPIDDRTLRGATLESLYRDPDASSAQRGQIDGTVELVAEVNAEGEVIGAFHYDPNNQPTGKGAALDPATDYFDPNGPKIDDVVYGATLESVDRSPDTGYPPDIRKRR
jgi:hypothetical protein